MGDRQLGRMCEKNDAVVAQADGACRLDIFLRFYGQDGGARNADKLRNAGNADGQHQVEHALSKSSYDDKGHQHVGTELKMSVKRHDDFSVGPPA